MRRLPSLADRVLAALPGFETAPMAREVAARLNTDEPHVRRAFEALEASGRARIVRRGNGLHLVPADHPGRICLHCRNEFERPKKSKCRCCCRSCSIKWSWTLPGVAERRYQAMVATRRTPEARARSVEINNDRWARPGERDKLSERNRKRWADPYTNAEQSVAIQRAQQTPARREFQSKQVKARWDDPAGREKLVTGIRKSKSDPAWRASFAEGLRRRWQLDRDKMLATSTANAKKATAAVKGRKQSAEHVRKRVEATKKAKSAP